MNRLRESIKWLLFPGFNLHARLRWRILPGHFGGAEPGRERLVLDAGCGNGMLSYRSFQRGNRVLGISIKEGEIERNRHLFNVRLGIPEERLEFRVWNLYEIDKLGLQFDEIICSEVLEHIVRDVEVCRSFWSALRPGGVLHLCCPNADHPDNRRHHLDEQEHGGHVRPGYTLDSYRALLEPIGFRIAETVGLGGPIRQGFNRRIIAAQEAGRHALAGLLFAVGAPLARLDPPNPRVPYSLYVRATRSSS
ncbi:MAG: methyltransferase domain-containing protein [Kiritimatiellae bacterium]|nr:methyltransferase domain-containing protein [Kiritimatiellia bacterium]